LCSTACGLSPWRWSEEKARSEWNRAVDGAVFLARAMRMTMFPSSAESRPKVARDLEATNWKYWIRSWSPACMSVGFHAPRMSQAGRMRSRTR
jgi:hypothetical protein